MLEIVLMVLLCKKIGRELRAKGVSPTGYQFLAVFLWIGGEILGFIVGSFLGASTGARGEPDMCFVCGLGFAGAATGAAIAYGIASSVSPAYPEKDNFDRPGDYFDPTGKDKPGGPENPFGDWPSDKFRP
jgi:hypothetical protein